MNAQLKTMPVAAMAGFIALTSACGSDIGGMVPGFCEVALVSPWQ